VVVDVVLKLVVVVDVVLKLVVVQLVVLLLVVLEIGGTRVYRGWILSYS